MKHFLDNNFLLQNKTAQKLYHNYAATMPIIDYHCHLNPKEIAENKQFETITQIWLNGDHYKWRAMRTFGIEEHYITGKANDWEKFEKWAEVVPFTVRNPLYHWTHLELQRYFGITDLLSPKTAPSIYKKCNQMLGNDDFSVLSLLNKMNVEMVCTTDDPVDNLEYHAQISSNQTKIKVLPAWRPDKAMCIDQPEIFLNYIQRLSEVCHKNISDLNDFMHCIELRHQFFHEMGSRLSDHGLDTFYSESYNKNEIEILFKKALNREPLNNQEIKQFKSFMLYEFAQMDWEKGWVQQFHYGVLRNNNTRKYHELGPDTGFDSIGQFNASQNMQQFFNRLDMEDKLSKTILYNINPADNEMIATMIGNFNDGSVAGKMQFGSAWWFLDQKDGIEKQLNALSNLGLISQFVGMLTDSRSFLSYPRHEYFRRILCNLFGSEIENGELPNDLEHIGAIVQDICYYNAKKYFELT